jgi:alpha-galactosidase
MIPGLWLEIEVMGIKCPLAKNLPDDFFFMRHGRRVIDHGRYQLDFRNPKVRDFATAIVDRLVNEYGVGYIKNDYNIDIGAGTELNADSVGDGLLCHNRAFINWLKGIRERHPALVWENCSSGGMRMEYASLSQADIQSVSDQTDYRFNAKVSAASATAVLPEQGAIWSYPKAKDSHDAFVMNMVNSMMQRVHLSGEVYGWNDEQLNEVKKAISVYKSIREDIKESLPFYPLGIPQYTDKFMCAAYKCKDCIRMAVWRMDTDEKEISIPFDNKVVSARAIYPLDFEGEIAIDNSTLKVTMPREYTAAIIEIITE